MPEDGRLVITVLGRDRPGIVATVTGVLARLHANIIKTRASTIFNDLFVIIMVVDTRTSIVKKDVLLNILKNSCDDVGLALAAESCQSYKCGKKVIVFDLDGTLIEQEVIEELAKAAGVGEEVKKITKLAMDGKLNFLEALRSRVKLLEGLPVEVLDQIKSSIKINPGVKELIAKLKELGFVIGIVTGSFDFAAEHVGRMIGADYVFSNRLIVKGGRLTGEVDGEMVGPEAKLKAIKTIAGKVGVGLEACVAVGDGANDLFMIENVGLGIGYKPKLVVRERAHGVVNTEDARVLLALIGCVDMRKDIICRI
ncbi:MAG: phosphoserine phosphatase SerB [Candidatus Verstraetearchaeota archaeon]|jgi:phosphoserine phosphatase|nr:phosphoserine phosphatase SerB [Candidatus Methanomethylicia archaeon]NHV60846.1 phosphoserine phosphatase SerB [Candidatus Verstraetearchaeota archaeon]